MLRKLRARALAATLAPPAALAEVIGRLGFVQADPIRSPARAQDLILRHRVAGYRVGGLEGAFRRLELEEDFLYAYGFMPREIANLLHPRLDPQGVAHSPTGLAADVLSFVRERGTTHPQELAKMFGKERAVNNWGGFSKATTRALQSLHFYGLLRVSHRRDGIRLYEAATRSTESVSRVERQQRLLLLVLRLLAPLPKRSLGPTLALLGRGAPQLRRDMPKALEKLLRSGEVESAEVDGETWFWPSEMPAPDTGSTSRKLRFLAPFDPVVWDRRRFAHLWGWEYRFEGYTPIGKRRRGYYAMPLLFGDEMIGWVNLARADGRLHVDAGFIRAAPRGEAFRRAFDAEVARFERFMKARD
ncbi:MAG: YcaQ family DNA glycosylase [Hyphomicrobiales bacterium]|nr:YcaQ family DNA glycosylase [Hyphomicrobiales bacterium]MBV9590139.1 YcaQ family DNA glycosylase [Hyphomicrobiales bacterium]